MLHRLCEPPSIPLSFSLATILPRRGTSRFRFGREPIGEPPTQCPSFTARTTGVSNPVRSPGFRVSASVDVQGLAFATGVPSDLNAFHRSTGSSSPPYVPPGISQGLAPLLPPRQEFTTRRPSSSTRRRSVRLAPIAEDSRLQPPVGVWAVSQSQCGRPPSQAGYPSSPW